MHVGFFRTGTVSNFVFFAFLKTLLASLMAWFFTALGKDTSTFLLVFLVFFFSFTISDTRSLIVEIYVLLISVKTTACSFVGSNLIFTVIVCDIVSLPF